VLDIDQSRGVVQTCVERGANLNRILSDGHRPRPDFDAHQINCTYYSALGCNDDAYLAARAIQLFSPGVPQVYYVGLLAGRNDLDAVQATGEGRAINRHNYSREEARLAVQAKVVQRLLRLIRFRNEHPAFGGQFAVSGSRDNELHLRWDGDGTWCVLDLDLSSFKATVSSSAGSGDAEGFVL